MKIEKTKLEEMSSELPERERRELLARIRGSQERGDREEVERVELKQEERERLMAQEMAQMSLWARFMLWLRSMLTGSSRRELFIATRIAALKHSIKALAPGISGFETRNLTPKFARQLYDLYHAAFPLRGLFQTFTRDERFRAEALVSLLASKYPEAKLDLEELVPASEMESAYAGSGSDEEVRKLTLRRFNDYLKRIPDKLFEQLEEGLKPLLYLRNVVLFPYSLMFRHFNYHPSEHLDEKYPYFDHAPAMLLLDLLERLFAGLGLAVHLGSDWFCHEELLNAYCRYRHDSQEEGSPGPLPPPELNDTREQETVHEAEELGAALFAVAGAASAFDQRIPVLDLLRFFRRDPYLRLAFAVPRLQLRPLYTTLLRDRFLGQFSEKLAAVKKAVLDRRLQQLFRSENLQGLFFYSDLPGFDYRKLGLPGFSHSRSLTVLYNYLTKLFKDYVLEAVQAAYSYVFPGNRIVQTRLMQGAGALEELEARIVLLDRSLSPEEEDGRSLAVLRSRVAVDPGQQKLYRSLVTQKDKEARDLLEQGSEHLQTIKRHFDDTVGSPAENVKAILKTLHFSRGRNQTLAVLLKSTADQIGEFLELLHQLQLLEKGS